MYKRQGLWHGATTAFIAWGALHGFFIIVERIGFKKILDKIGFLRYVYTGLVVLIDWVIFRVANLQPALQYIRRMLTPWQYTPVSYTHLDVYKRQVYTATAGNAALKEVEKKPDIILLDVNMPDIDGFTVCERIRDYVSCPIIFLTARIEDSDKIKGFSIGADDYVIKPFSVDELEARIAAPVSYTHLLGCFGEHLLDKRIYPGEILLSPKWQQTN